MNAKLATRNLRQTRNLIDQARYRTVLTLRDSAWESRFWATGVQAMNSAITVEISGEAGRYFFRVIGKSGFVDGIFYKTDGYYVAWAEEFEAARWFEPSVRIIGFDAEQAKAAILSAIIALDLGWTVNGLPACYAAWAKASKADFD